MKILSHQLVSEVGDPEIHIENSPNQKDLITADKLPRDIIIHYTAGGLVGSLATFLKPDSTSAHLIIDRDGSIYQLVPFNRQAFHAGSSIWDENSSFNGRSIGIELINMGWDVASLSATDILTTSHKHKFVNKTQWEIFKPPQLTTLYNVTQLLLETYDIKRILGHDDISAGRKQDPGPAFPWDEFRTSLFSTSNNIGKIFKTKGNGIHLRKGDGTHFGSIIQLSKNYEVGLIETWNNWSKVYLSNKAEDVVTTVMVDGKPKQKNIKTMGWIRSDLLELK